VKTSRLRLRRFSHADLPTFLAYRNDLETAYYEGREPITPEAAQQFIDSMQIIEPGNPGEWFQIAIELQQTGVHIGDIGFRVQSSTLGQAEIGYRLARAYHGQGYGQEAVEAVLGYAFAVLGIHRITATVDTRNLPSIRLLERMGFRREGHFQESYWLYDHWTDDFLYAILAHDWEGKRAEKNPERSR
jgi:RimJ/RimL family protein N-acetyltransferase